MPNLEDSVASTLYKSDGQSPSLPTAPLVNSVFGEEACKFKVMNHANCWFLDCWLYLGKYFTWLEIVLGELNRLGYACRKSFILSRQL